MSEKEIKDNTIDSNAVDAAKKVKLDEKLQEAEKTSLKGYIALIATMLFFSGIFSNNDNWTDAFNISELIGDFGKISGGNFIGKGGYGAKQGFLFSLSLIPGIMLALGIVEVATHFGALKAAQKMLTPLFRPLMGLPGIVGLTLISSMQSTDAGAAMTRELFENGYITEEERLICAAFQFSAGAAILNYLTTGMAVFSFLDISLLFPLTIILIYKLVGVNVMRIYIKTFTHKGI